jgi:hypothetical protein
MGIPREHLILLPLPSGVRTVYLGLGETILYVFNECSC